MIHPYAHRFTCIPRIVPFLHVQPPLNTQIFYSNVSPIFTNFCIIQSFVFIYPKMDVDTSNKKDVWLVKIPKYLANSWKVAPDRAELGKLHIPNTDSKEPIKFIRNQKTGPTDLPSEHHLTLRPLDSQRMFILSQTESEKISFEGDVKQRGELRPTGDTSYMNLKTLSIKEAAKPNRVTQILDKAVASYKPRSAIKLALDADLRKKKDESKKMIREDKEIVQGRLFSAFEKQQYYNIKDLVSITNQSIPYLKEILKEICNYCSNGAHKNMWELKPEYRHYRSASGSKVKTET